MLARDLKEIYLEMLADLHWDEARPWQTVGHFLKELLRSRKTYGWFYDAAGQKHRLRYYRFPKQSREPLVESMQHAAS